MSTTKRISGDYTIQSVGTTDKININTSLVTINGNLVVTGATSAVTSTNTAIWDNIITLNNGLSPGIAPTLNAGIEVDRGTLANVQLLWNETVKAWQVYNGSITANIALVGALTTANLDMMNYSIYSSTNSNVKFDDNVAIQNTTVAPPASAGYNTLYSSTVAGGGSGLYITNTTKTAQELATQAAAIKYSIIFG